MTPLHLGIFKFLGRQNGANARYLLKFITFVDVQSAILLN